MLSLKDVFALSIYKQ